MTKHWEELMAYTNIGSVLIDNNCGERAVRPFTNLRKNFGGFSSEHGARVTATYLTFVETCRCMLAWVETVGIVWCPDILLELVNHWQIVTVTTLENVVSIQPL